MGKKCINVKLLIASRHWAVLEHSPLPGSFWHDSRTSGHSQVMGTVKDGHDRSLQLMGYRAQVEKAPPGKIFWSWTVRNSHSLFAHACPSPPTPFYTSRVFLQKNTPPNSLPSRTMPIETKHKSPFSSCGYLVWTRLVRSPPSSKIMLRGCPSLKYRVCSMHHKYSSSVSPFQANTAWEQTHSISQFLTQHVVKQPKEDFISSSQ